MPRHPAPLPTGLGDVFRRADGLRAGASARRLRAAGLDAPFHGVRALPAPPAPFDDEPSARDRESRRMVLLSAHAYRLVAPAGAFFAARTAAILQGLPVEHGPELDVGVCAPRRAPRARGIRGVKVEPTLVEITRVAGLPVSSAATTWAMLARELTVRQLVIVGDAIVNVPRDRAGIPCPEARLATIEELRSAAEAGRRLGAARLRRALELIRVGSMSPSETRFRLDAGEHGLPEPELDVEISGRGGRLLGISEIVYSRWRVVVEVEGDHHRTSRRQWNRDIDKYAAYAADGWEVVRLTGEHLRSGRAVGLVADVLTRRGWQRSRQLPH